MRVNKCLAGVMVASLWLVLPAMGQSEGREALRHDALSPPRTEPSPRRYKETPPRPLNEYSTKRPHAGAIWIPGYWDVDRERGQYTWVSGAWRTPPPGRRWQDGYWAKDDRGWYRVPGYWYDEVGFRKEGPPPPPEQGERPPKPEGPGPWIWIEGHYEPKGTETVWVPGYWHKGTPGWTWVDAAWLRRPGEWIFQRGFWVRTDEWQGPGADPASLVRIPGPTIDRSAADSYMAWLLSRTPQAAGSEATIPQLNLNAVYGNPLGPINLWPGQGAGGVAPGVWSGVPGNSNVTVPGVNPGYATGFRPAYYIGHALPGTSYPSVAGAPTASPGTSTYIGNSLPGTSYPSVAGAPAASPGTSFYIGNSLPGTSYGTFTTAGTSVNGYGYGPAPPGSTGGQIGASTNR